MILEEAIELLQVENIANNDAEKLNGQVGFFTEPRYENYLPLSEHFTQRFDYINDFLSYARSRLNNQESYLNFEKALSMPMEVTSLLKSCNDILSKVFNAKDRNQSLQITKKESENEAIQFLNLLKIQEKIWKTFTNEPCTILYVEMEPEENEIEICRIRPDRVINVEIENNEIAAFSFRTSDGLAVICDEYYRLFNLQHELILESPHKIGICPAVFASNEYFSRHNKLQRANQFTQTLSMIKELQFLYILKKILNPHSFYQFIERFRQTDSCEYDNGVQYCVSGWLADKTTGKLVTDQFGSMKCPNCNKDMGVGKIIEKPMPMNTQDVVLDNVIRFVAPDTDILKYGDDFLADYEYKILNNVTGKQKQVNTKVSQNETAYKYNMDLEKSVILNLKKNLEFTINRLSFFALKLKYGDSLTSYYLNLGTEFALTDLSTLYEELSLARLNGIDDILNINQQIIDTKFSTNPNQHLRATLLNNFKPNLNGTVAEIDAAYTTGLIPQEIYLKQRFLNDFLQWILTNKIPIEMFNTEIPVYEHLKTLNKWFTEYTTTLIIPQINENKQTGNQPQ